MKPKILYLVTTILSCGLFCACSNDYTDIEFGSVTVDRQVKLTDEEKSPECKVHLQIHFATNENSEVARIVNDAIESRLFSMELLDMQQAADSFANQYTGKYLRDMLPLYKEDRSDTTKRAWYEFHYVVTTNTQKGRKGIAVYQITTDYYEGGAHGINQTTTINFDTKTGKPLSLDDVFVPGYAKELNKILLQALKDKVGVSSTRELHDKGYLLSMDIFAPRNFILGDETITFIYNIYEIAPYAMGTTELAIGYNDLKALLKKTE